jgi:ribose-phosphate pyrophosphokinase
LTQESTAACSWELAPEPLCSACCSACCCCTLPPQQKTPQQPQQGRESIAAKLTANLITEAGADRVLAMDLHSGQCVGYFDIPVDHVYGETVILDYLASKRIATGELVVVSPDVGGVARARAFAKKLNDAPLAIIDKRRSAHNVSEVMHLIGDVKGKVAVLVDDMIDTAGTITNAGKALLQEGAREVRVQCRQGLG